MKWPLILPAVRRDEIPLYNLYYLHAARGGDPTMVWGTDVDGTGLRQYLRDMNRVSPVLISSAHVLLRATAVALAAHPEFNRRAVGSRLYAYRQVNVRMAYHNPRTGEVDVLLIEQADLRSVSEIAQQVWQLLLSGTRGQGAFQRDRRRLRRLPPRVFHLLFRLYGWLDRSFPLPTVSRLDRLRQAAVLVNDLSFRGAPPMRSYKPSTFPDESVTLNVTLGPMEEKAVVRGGQLVTASVAPLFVRADHRITDAFGLGRFVGTLRQALEDPAGMDLPAARGSLPPGGTCQAA